MNTVEVNSGYAFTTLVERMTRVDGYQLSDVDEWCGRLRVTYPRDEAKRVSNILVNLLFHEWLYDYLLRRLAEDVGQLTDDEIEYLVLVHMHALRTENLLLGTKSFEDWVETTELEFSRLLENAQAISLDGFVRFRLRTFIACVMAGLHERIQQFMLDREYEESVAMLRYMLDAQPHSAQELHVFCTEDRVWITDATGGLLRDIEVTEAALAESGGELDSEDLAMSILITRSPCRIMLHNLFPNAPWPSFSDTVSRVFSERVQPCGGCSTCQQLAQVHHYLPLDAAGHHRTRRNH